MKNFILITILTLMPFCGYSEDNIQLDFRVLQNLYGDNFSKQTISLESIFKIFGPWGLEKYDDYDKIQLDVKCYEKREPIAFFREEPAFVFLPAGKFYDLGTKLQSRIC